MRSIRYSDDEVAEILRSVDRMFGQRIPITEICRLQGISRSTFYRWQRQHGLCSTRRNGRGHSERFATVSEEAQSARLAILEKSIRTQEHQIKALRVVAEGN